MLEEMGDALAYQGGLAVMAVHILELVKRSDHFPFLNRYSDTINRTVSFVFAMIGGLGIRALFHGSLVTGGQLIVTIPAISVIIDSLVHMSLQFGFQQFYFQTAVKRPEATTAVAVAVSKEAGKPDLVDTSISHK